MTNESLFHELIQHQLFLHNEEICRDVIASKPRIFDLAIGDELICEGDTKDQSIYSILSGTLGIKIGKQIVSVKRHKHQHVGEMAFISNEPRSATVFAKEPSRVVRITARTFRRLLGKFPEMWRPLAEVLSDRLRERKGMLRPSNTQPNVFVGSSGKKVAVAKKLERLLVQAIPCKVDVWHDPNIFRLSQTNIHTLIDKAKQSDFGIFVFGADDLISSKGKRTEGPRDNVVFETGLFIGACGLDRTFVLTEGDMKLKIPSDLDGVITGHFFIPDTRSPRIDARSLKRIVNAIQTHGVR